MKLRPLQQWTLEAVIDPSSASAHEKHIKPSHSLSASERVNVYAEMYPLRVRDAMAADYPGVKHYLGEAKFETLVDRYSKKYPSRNYTLNRLGDHFPKYLARDPDLRLRELARLELVMTEVFDEAETSVLTPQAVAQWDESMWAEAKLTPIAAFRLVTLQYPVHLYLDALREDTQPPALRKRATRLAVYRQNYQIRRLELTQPALLVLQRLAKGTPIAKAIRGINPQQCFQWFRQWMSEGMFAATAPAPGDSSSSPRAKASRRAT